MSTCHMPIQSILPVHHGAAHAAGRQHLQQPVPCRLSRLRHAICRAVSTHRKPGWRKFTSCCSFWNMLHDDAGLDGGALIDKTTLPARSHVTTPCKAALGMSAAHAQLVHAHGSRRT